MGVFALADNDRLAVYYDGACPLCSAAADGWRSGADRSGLVLCPLQEFAPPKDGPSSEDLQRAIHVHGPDGWLSGAHALRAVYRRLGNRPMTALLTLGIALGVADPVYRLLARHRTHVPLPRSFARRAASRSDQRSHDTRREHP